MNLIIDTATGRSWAATIEQLSAHWWMVLWEPGGQHLTGYYRGPWSAGGVYHKAKTPDELWTRIVRTQAESRRRAAASASSKVPPLLPDELPDALRRAAG